MTNYTQKRNNMIAGQFLPGLIKDIKILDIFGSISRENFLPEKFKMLAYSDSNIKIKNNRFIPSPFNLAKILEEIKFIGTEMVLLLGSNTGYEAAVISKLFNAVVAVEEDKGMKTLAEKIIKDFKIENIVFINNDHNLGHKKLGPYEIIISLDPLVQITNSLLLQLSENGKLYYFERQNDIISESKLSVIYKTKNKYMKQQLFDLNTLCPVKQEENVNFNFG